MSLCEMSQCEKSRCQMSHSAPFLHVRHMPLTSLPEHVLQRAVHALLSDPGRTWTCTNGDVVQVVAAGTRNVYEGPDFRDAAVLFNGTVYVGDVEFHVRSSHWMAHQHHTDVRYASLLIHVVMEHDAPMEHVARWTLVLREVDILAKLRKLERLPHATDVDVEALQHFALLRLLRQSVDADTLLRRLGPREALRALVAQWLDRMSAKRQRPHDQKVLEALRETVTDSAMGGLVERLREVPPDQLLPAIDQAERRSICGEGVALRREVFTNCALPLMCTMASQEQRIVLLQWYWGAKSVHAYGVLRRRFPEQQQERVWQQQGMLEHLRAHGRRTSTCAEQIKAYGLSRTVDFLDAGAEP